MEERKTSSGFGGCIIESVVGLCSRRSVVGILPFPSGKSSGLNNAQVCLKSHKPKHLLESKLGNCHNTLFDRHYQALFSGGDTLWLSSCSGDSCRCQQRNVSSSKQCVSRFIERYHT